MAFLTLLCILSGLGTGLIQVPILKEARPGSRTPIKMLVGLNNGVYGKKGTFSLS